MKIVILLFFIIYSVVSFDAAKFEKCEQKSFCKRLRTTEQSFYTNDRNSKNGIMDTFQSRFELVDKKNPFKDPLFVDVFAYEKGIFRLQIKEKTEKEELLKHRTEVKDVLDKYALKRRIGQQETNVQGSLPDNYIFYFDDKPWRATLLKDNKKVLVFNALSSLTIENKSRPKSEEVDPKTNETRKYEGESAIRFDVSFAGADHIYGIPERAMDLNLPDTIKEGTFLTEPYRLYNLDVFRFDLNNPMGLYGSIPFLMSIGPEGASGIFSMNPSETFIDIERGINGVNSKWVSETGLLDIFILPGPTVKDVISQYAYLTGTPPLPQLFSLGYHQCRWNYKDEADVKQVNGKFNEHNIPYDVLWLDIEHTDDKKYFTWDSLKFPNPIHMQNRVARDGRKMVTISDPHIKRASGYHVHEEATRLGYYVKNSDGNDYEGHCWPGSSSWLDFFNPDVRKWYGGLYAYDKYQGSTKNLYTWIDMNEPSVFSGPEITMHKNAIHHGGVEHGAVHNQYGFYQSMAVYEGHVNRQDGNDRPFILSRAFFSGSQRYVAVWTGDNQARWDHLDKGNAQLLTLGISGLQFVGADVGGFFDDPTPELLVRFYQTGAFYPFFRGHAEIQTKRREPWLFGAENTKLIRAAIVRRYNLLPFYYTLFYHSSYTGWPIMRPLFMEFSSDKKTLSMQDQFLIGDALLIKPVTQEGQTTTNVYIPAGQPWYDYETGEKYLSYKEHTMNTPMNKIAVLQRGGTVIPLKKRVRKSTFQMRDDPYTLQIALSSSGRAEGDLYVDDGHSFNYKKNGEYTYRKFDVEKTLSSTIIENITNHPLTKSGFKLKNVVEKIVVFGFDKPPTKVIANIPELKDSTVGLESEMNLDFEFKENILTIRTKSLPIITNWKVVIE